MVFILEDVTSDKRLDVTSVNLHSKCLLGTAQKDLTVDLESPGLGLFVRGVGEQEKETTTSCFLGSILGWLQVYLVDGKNELQALL